MDWKWEKRPCDAGCSRRGCGVECGDERLTESGERGGSTLVTWYSWMEVFMLGLKNEGLAVV
jgi:hypothetical protein